MTAQEFYEQQTLLLNNLLKKLLLKKKYFGWLRFINIIAIFTAFYFLWPFGLGYIIPVVAILFFSFIQLIYADIANKEFIIHNQQLVLVNKEEQNALQHNYFNFNNGSQHTPKDHFYANDMDIFGHASLFQFLNRTVSEIGSAKLAQWLLQAASAKEIYQRQEAIKELSNKISWGQQLQAHGKKNPISLKTRDRLLYWLNEIPCFSNFKLWSWLRYVLPAISVTVTFCTIFSSLPLNVFYVNMLVMAIVALPQEKKINQLHNHLSKMVAELQTLSQSIKIIEEQNFTSALLLELKMQYKQQATTTSEKIKKLQKILDRLDLRFNIVLVFPLNLLLLWNLQQAIQLDNWKKENSATMPTWFDTLGRFEALLSFGVIYFNNPMWTFPVLTKNHFCIEAYEMGHPLITQNKRINNFIKIDDKASVMLVTGSNMAGKSTYLRSTGINVILAMAGAPVCAKTFILSPVQLISSMRISDNLEENTSTFYAELKKLKTIIEKVNNSEKVFILLDEILRGTNSLDRNTGSQALIKQLIQKGAAAIIATHDVALADLQKDFPVNIFNFHFDVQVNIEDLYFDYLLKPGVCTSMNASILMKKIGIEI